MDHAPEDEMPKNYGYNKSVDQAMHQYEFYQDCIALSPITFGKPGAYIQSDIQFAQKAIQYIRELVVFDSENSSKIIDDVHMDILTRFFIK